MKELKNSIQTWLKRYLMRLKRLLRKRDRNFHIDGIIDGVIIGWFISRRGTSAIEILIDGEKVDKITEFISASEIHPDAYRFYYDLKKKVIPEEGSEITVVWLDEKVKKVSFKLTKDLIFGRIDGFSGIECFGWAGSAFGNLPRLLVSIENEIFEPEIKWSTRDDFRKFGIKIPTGFSFTIPEKYLDGRIYRISILNPHTQQKLCSDREYRFTVKQFFINMADLDAIAGWLQVGDYPGPVDLDIYIENKKIGTVRADILREDAIKEYGEGCYGFYFPITEKERAIIKGKENYSFSVFIHNTSIRLSKCNTVSIIDIIEELEKVAQFIREQDNEYMTKYIKVAIESMRINLIRNLSKKIVLKDSEEICNKLSKSDIIDIIIPVYKGRKETLECINSVLEARTDVEYELILIDDCSPDPELKKELKRIASRKGITLIENRENLGFVKSANIGMRLHPDRDVVLLNSDTLVPDYWLDRLKRTAYSARNIATVTPLSNRATILSIPNPNVDNEIPDGFDFRTMDEICQKVNSGIYVDIPTAIGFCMYIKRECINEVGYFDEERFGRGYGEENDFCMRASALGWRHVACLDLFVQHHGSLSFGAEKPARIKKAMEVIDRLYPDYQQRVQRFIRKDPIAVYRNRINRELIKRKCPEFILFILHTWGGGSHRYCRDLAKLLAEKNIGSLFLLCKDEKITLLLYEPEREPDATISLQFPVYIPLEKIVESIKEIPIVAVHFNQVMNFRDIKIWQIPEWLGVPYYVTIHDYFYICPRINLIDSRKVFCGLTEVELCEECLSDTLPEADIEYLYRKVFGSSIRKWRRFYEEKLRGAKKVIFPSESALYYFRKLFNLQNSVVYSHPEAFRAKIASTRRREKLKIAVIGAIGEHKGYNQLLRLIEFSEREGLPFEFVIVGYTKNDRAFRRFGNVTITGAYEEKALSGLIKYYGPEVALFLHIWPETYGYTLSEALQNGLYPVAYDLGAIAERMKKLGIGTLIPYPASVEKIAHVLLEIYHRGWEEREVVVSNVYDITRDYYEIVEKIH